MEAFGTRMDLTFYTPVHLYTCIFIIVVVQARLVSLVDPTSLSTITSRDATQMSHFNTHKSSEIFPQVVIALFTACPLSSTFGQTPGNYAGSYSAPCAVLCCAKPLRTSNLPFRNSLGAEKLRSSVLARC